MQIQNLRPADGEKTKSFRVGRGIGSGKGKTSGKGHKGQWARSGGGVRPGFEGGNIPLIRKIPIRGFNNYNFRKRYSTVNVGSLEIYEPNTEITLELLYADRVVGKIEPNGLKVLGGGELTKPLIIKASKFTDSAKEKIEKVGGKIEIEE
ncbi:MAG: 50S ribosomal protein L15 [Candidatus Gastranaerophilales bacterium]|nr:50S ribosomal protein L15 [Clostridia bacterium]MBQ8886710.1 50S ribosomal protein L15 [Candidatus Gastranaerophilales bacterium]